MKLQKISKYTCMNFINKIDYINIIQGVIKMYAVIKSGGKQFKVSKGQIVKVARIKSEIGEEISISDVLMCIDGDKTLVGSPHLENASVTCSIVDHKRDKKVNIIKFKRRKHHMKRMGHRQDFTEIKILDIKV